MAETSILLRSRLDSGLFLNGLKLFEVNIKNDTETAAQT